PARDGTGARDQLPDGPLAGGGARSCPGFRATCRRRRRRRGNDRARRGQDARGDPRGCRPTRVERRGRGHRDPGTREDRTMTAATTGQLAHDIGAEGIVSIRVRDGDLRIRAVDGDTLRIRDASARDLDGRFDIVLGEGSASLLDRTGRADGWTSHRGGSPELDIELPPRTTLVVETVSAEIKAEGLIAEQRYQTTSGDITLRAVSGGLVIEAVSADLDIRATGDAQVTARTVSGDIELRAGTLRAREVTTTRGDVGGG